MKSDTREFYEELSCHLNFHLDQEILMTILHEVLHAFLCIFGELLAKYLSEQKMFLVKFVEET
jgi:hypothetical protein